MFDEHNDAVRSSLRRVTLTSVDDTGTQQRLGLTGLVGESFANVVRLQHFGDASNPPSGAEGLILPQGGRSDRAWAMGFEHPDHRVNNLPSGGRAIFDSAGNVIKLVGDNVTFTFEGHAWSAKSKGLSIDATGDVVTIKTDKHLYLGADASACKRVMTESGPSQRVWAAFP